MMQNYESGIETLGYEVVEEPDENQTSGAFSYKPAAELLASFGRNEDTYVVHAAEGETVIPTKVLEANPRMRAMIYKQLNEMGLDPQRYVVGNTMNSINPDTGMPEFLFKKIGRAIKKTVKRVVNIAKKLAPIVLPIIAPFAFPLMPMAFATGLGSLAGSLIAGASLKDALKGAVISGGLAGLGNMAFRGSEGFGSGSFLGSKANPMGSLANASTSMANPFTGNMIGTGLPPEKAIIAPKLPPVDGTASVDSGGAFKDLGKVLKPGDDYGITDYYKEYISPSRSGIQPSTADVAKLGAENAASTIQTTNAELAKAGLNPLDGSAIASITKDSMANAASELAPGALQKFAPVGVLATAALAPLAKPVEEGLPDNIGEFENTGTKVLNADIADGTYDYGFDPEVFVGDNPAYVANAGDQSGTSSTNDIGSGGAVLESFVQPVDNGNTYGSQYQTSQQTGNFDPFASNLLIDQYGNPISPQVAIEPPNRGMVDVNYQTFASGGPVSGPGTSRSDSVPAMLSDGEFVMNARAVRGAGQGDRQEGAKRMYAMMRQFEQGA
tara:strand:- start:4766 stop:6430 length:1665 start_codon:yes stop_codon:yes gene_type:complete